MGEVYRARDTKLDRDVAIKVLPELFASDPERIARFEREAKTLATLNHPHIAAIYGFEEANGVRALVMELVEGPTLADRIAHGPIPIDEALPIAKQIAEALEVAHEQGIIHRDLKPANVKVREDGTVKVLDFGLAKVPESRGAVRDATLSPTMTSPALMTGVGMLLGTAAYMSPEQARGRPADKRSDIWALGCVLYEMLTGRRAFGSVVSGFSRTFTGADEAQSHDDAGVADTLAAVLRATPDWTALPRDLPSNVRTVLERSLEKDRRARIPDVSVIRFVLESRAEPQFSSSGSPRTSSWVAVGATALIAGVVAAGVTWLAMRPDAPAPIQPFRFALIPPSDQIFTLNAADRALAISPDGSRVVYAVGQGELRVRSADRLEAESLPGITGARAPFISPDGRWIGFFEGAELKKVSIDGGPPISLTPHSGTPRGGSWGPDGTIVFATGSTTSGLLSVSADGGEAVVLTRPDSARGELDHLFPFVMPNGRGVVFTASRVGPELQLMALDLTTRQQKVLIRGASGAQYISTGHLIYALGGKLHAVPFDPERLEIVGEGVALAEPITVLPIGVAAFSVSRTGTLVYIPAAANGLAVGARTLVWVDRKGREEPLSATPRRTYSVPRLSPDDRQLALLSAEQDLDLWMWDIARRTLRRLTIDPGQEAMPAWTPDGQRLIFSSAQSGPPNVFWMRASGAGQPERLTTSPNTQYPMAIAPDGKLGVLLEQKNTGNDLMLLRLPEPSGNAPSGKATVEPLLATMFNETNASISPDGRFLAYQSNEDGQMQVYVRPFPNVNDGIWPISTNGGRVPVWARNGKELFYAELDGTIMAVPVRTAPTFTAGNATKLFRWPTLDLPSPARNYDVTRDGQRFVMIKEPDGTGSDSARAPASTIVMVVNWIETLKETR